MGLKGVRKRIYFESGYFFVCEKRCFNEKENIVL